MGKKKTAWHRARHNFWWHVMRFLMRFYCTFKYRYKIKKLDNRKEPYLVLFNHPTPIDPLMTCIALKKYAYIVCTEDLYTMGSTTRFIRHAVAPIPFKKSMADARAVMTCMRAVKEGYSIVLSAEGNRTFTGKTCAIKPAIAKLIKSLKIPVAVYKFTGGYTVHPRFADKPRRGARVMGETAAVLRPEEYKDMSLEDIYAWVVDKMSFDESDAGVVIKSNKRAEHMERAVYWCPVCGGFGGLESKGNDLRCNLCGNVVTVDKYGRFPQTFAARTPGEWIELQNGRINSLSIEEYKDKPITVDGGILFRKLLNDKECKETLLENVEVRLFSDRLEVGTDYVFAFDDISAVTACGRNRVDFYCGDITYQFSSKKPLAILKYANIFYHYKNIKENIEDGFLGI